MSDFSKRLKKALEMRDIQPHELSTRTGISQSSISEYLSDKVSARQDKILLMSKALGVDPAWLMGADVPMERKDRVGIINDPDPFNPVNVFINDLVIALKISELSDIPPEIMLKINQLSMECTLRAISLAISKNNSK